MAYVNSTTRPASRNAAILDIVAAFGTFFGSIVDSFRRYRVYQATFESLNHLSDAELRDLGISRYEISRVAGEAAFLKN